MAQTRRTEILKNSIEKGDIKEFHELFFSAVKGDVAEAAGIGYARFLKLVNDPSPLRYAETALIAKYFGVEPVAISILIHNQLNKKPSSRKKS